MLIIRRDEGECVEISLEDGRKLVIGLGKLTKNRARLAFVFFDGIEIKKSSKSLDDYWKEEKFGTTSTGEPQPEANADIGSTVENRDIDNGSPDTHPGMHREGTSDPQVP